MVKRFINKHSPKPKNTPNIFVHSFEDSSYDKLEHSLIDISENFTKGLLPIFDKEFKKIYKRQKIQKEED